MNAPSKIFQRLSSKNITWSILEYFVPYKTFVECSYMNKENKLLPLFLCFTF